MKTRLILRILPIVGIVFLVSTASAGPVFLSGHDPDYHAQDRSGKGEEAKKLLLIGLDFVTEGNAEHDYGGKFLWIESRIDPPSGHRAGNTALDMLGLKPGTHFDQVSADDLKSVDFSEYTAIVIASSFGGTLTRAELDALITRKEDLLDFMGNGGGLLAFAEGHGKSESEDLLSGDSPAELFGFLPVPVVADGSPPRPPFTVTPYGASLGLTDADVERDAGHTHNWFSSTGGLNVVDTDGKGRAVTLAGFVTLEGDEVHVHP